MMFGIALAQEIVTDAANAIPAAQGFLDSFIEALMSKIPAETIAWVIAVLALLNGISYGLEKLAALTKNKEDDKYAAGLAKVVGWLKWLIDFLVAKGKGAYTPQVKDDQKPATDGKGEELPKA